MRPINIQTDLTFENISLENVPDEFLFIEALAKRHAITVEDLQRFYDVGYAAATKFKATTDEKQYDAKVAWVVEQTIKQAKSV